MAILEIAEVAKRLGANAEDISDLFNKGILGEDIYFIKAGRCLIPDFLLEDVRSILKQNDLPVNEPYQEEEINWLVDIDKLDYVRETWTYAPFRRAKPSLEGCDGRLVGFATLRRDAENCGFRRKFDRRIFYLMPHDRDSEPNGTYKVSCPCESVDPRTVKPNIKGQQTKQCWSG